MVPEIYTVYVQTNAEGHITAINSDAFLSDLDDWTLIDAGYGDKCHHAQGNYFEQPLMDDRGVYRYKLVDSQPVERTQEEMDADYAARPEPEPTEEEKEKTLMNAKIQALVDRNEFLEDCVAEMAAIIYA